MMVNPVIAIILYRILAMGIICKIYIWRTFEYLLSELVFWIAQDETFSRHLLRILDPLKNYSNVIFSEKIPLKGTVYTTTRKVFISDMDSLYDVCTYRFRLVVLMNHILYGYLRFSDVRRFLIMAIKPNPAYLKHTYIYILTQHDFQPSMSLSTGYVRINIGTKSTNVSVSEPGKTNEIFHDVVFNTVNMSIQKPVQTYVDLAELELLSDPVV